MTSWPFHVTNFPKSSCSPGSERDAPGTTEGSGDTAAGRAIDTRRRCADGSFISSAACAMVATSSASIIAGALG